MLNPIRRYLEESRLRFFVLNKSSSDQGLSSFQKYNKSHKKIIDIVFAIPSHTICCVRRTDWNSSCFNRIWEEHVLSQYTSEKTVILVTEFGIKLISFCHKSNNGYKLTCALCDWPKNTNKHLKMFTSVYISKYKIFFRF